MAINLRGAIRAINSAVLVSGSLSALAFSGSVFAAEESAKQIEEVEVLGIRQSLQDSMNTKRFANSIVDAISAEDIGKFPDKNVAESLSRLSGVSVSRDFGEGEKISVRGTSPTQNRTLLNGSAVASADWFVLDNPSRAFNYTLLPSTVVAKLEVYKSPQADIQEGSLGGTVNLITRKPLDMDPNTGSVQLQEQYSDNSEEWDPQVSGLYSWKNDDETFGALISLTKQDRSLQRNGSEVLGWTRQNLGGDDYWIPRAIGEAYFAQERERETGLATIQWRPNDASELSVTYLNSELSANNQNYNNYIWFNDQLGNGATIDPDSIVTSGDAVIAGEIVSGGTPYAEYYVIDRESYSETESLDVDFSYDAGSFIFTAKAGMTEAEGGTSSDQQYGFDRVLDGGASFSGTNSVGYHGGGIETNDVLLTRGLGYMQQNRRIMNDEEKYAGFDFEIPVEVGSFTSFKTGMHYRDHDKSQLTDGIRFHWLADSQHEAGATSYGAGSTANWSRWLYGNLNAGTLGDYAVSGDASYPLMDLDAAGSVIYPSEAYNFPTTDFLFLPETWDVNEKITAAYFKADFEGENFRGNVGVRVVRTEVASTGYKWNGDWVAASISQIGGYDLLSAAVQGSDNFDYDVRQETENHDYTNVLPHLNIAYDLNDDTILRMSLARVMSRPDYITIASQSASNVDTRTGSRGNPYLDPEVSDQLDLAYEWYFAEDAMLAATFFYKDIDGSAYNTITKESVYDPKLDMNVDVEFSEPVNGDGAKIKGLELSYQQNFGGFGVVANYTFTDADSKDPRDPVKNVGSGLVSNVSDHLFNVSGFYENHFMSARLSYNYRTEFYNGVDNFGTEYYTDDYGQWDASMSFAVTDSIDVVLEAVNLTDEEIEQYHIDESRTSNVYKNGRRFVIGVNASF